MIQGRRERERGKPSERRSKRREQKLKTGGRVVTQTVHKNGSAPVGT